MGSPDRWGDKAPGAPSGAQVPSTFLLCHLWEGCLHFLGHDFPQLLSPRHVLVRLFSLCIPLIDSVYPSMMNSASCWFLTKTRFIAYDMDVHSFLTSSLRPSCYFSLPRQIIIFVCLFCVYVVLQTELRPQDMPDKGLVAELHFQAKAPEIWLGLIQGPGHNSAIMGWLILIPEPKYPWQLGIVPLSVWQVSALSYRAQGQSAYYMTVSFSLPLVSKWASSKAFPLSLLAVLGSPHSQRSHFFTGQWIHLRQTPTSCLTAWGLRCGNVSCIPRLSPDPVDC